VSTSQLNKIVGSAFLTNTPRFAKNKVCKIYYLTQKSTNPQVFLTFVNDVSRVNQMFKRWLENTLKKHLPLKHVPLLFEFKSSHERKED
jgi:predicted GTPase